MKKLQMIGITLEELKDSIRIEFEKILESYYFFNVELDGNTDAYVATNNSIFNELIDWCNNGKLYTTIHNNLIFEEQSAIKKGFKELKDNNLTYYKFNSEDYFDWFKTRTYSKAFASGYNNIFNSDYDIFSTVYRKLNGSINNVSELLNEYYSLPVLDHYRFLVFAEYEGKFIKAWEIILDRPNDFYQFFDEMTD